MKTLPICLLLAIGVSGLLADSVFCQEYSLESDWQRYAMVNPSRVLPDTLQFAPRIAVTRTAIVDADGGIDQEPDQWTDDLGSAQNKEILVDFSTAFSTTVSLHSYAPVDVSQLAPEVRTQIESRLKIHRELTEGMWNWTLRNRVPPTGHRTQSGFTFAQSNPEGVWQFGGVGFVR